MRKVSVIIPTFNRKENLRICLQSIYKQNYTNFEILVIDNGSRDQTKEMILSEYPSVKLFLNKRNLFACKARNLGIAKSLGYYLWFIDSDSVVVNESCLSKMIELMESNPTIGSIGGTIYLFKDNSTKIVLPQNGIFKMVDEKKLGPSELVTCDFLPTSNILVRKRTLLEIGGFREIYKYMLEDNDLGLRIARGGFKNYVNKETLASHPFKPAVHTLEKSYNFYRNTFLYIFLNFPCTKWHKLVMDKFAKSRFVKNEKYDKINKIPVYAGICLGFVGSIFSILTPAFWRSKYFITRIKKRSKTLQITEIILHILGKLPHFIQNILVNIFIIFKHIQLKCRKGPAKITFFITNKCNLGCKHCFYINDINQPINELTYSEIAKILKSLPNKLDNICLTGGEPFLRNDLEKICVMIDREKIARSITIPTNGYDAGLIIKNILVILQKIRMKLYIQISLDGLQETHDGQRNMPGIFEQVTALVKRLQEVQKYKKNLSIGIETTVCKYNYQELLELDDFIHSEFGDMPHTFQFVRFGKYVGNIADRKMVEDAEPYSQLFDMPPLDVARRLVLQYIEKHRTDRLMRWKMLSNLYQIDILEKKTRILPCPAGILTTVIYPNGDLSFCEMIKPFANLRDYDYSLQKFWRSKKADKYRGITSHCFCIHSCSIGDALHYNREPLLKLINYK